MEGDRVRRDKARKRKFETDAKRLKKHDAFENDRASKQRLRHNSKTSDVPSPAKRKEIKWNDSNTHGLDFATMIKGYDSMTSAERLKARTRYLEKQYGSVATLDANRRKFEGLVDAEDDLESLKKEEIVSIRTHDDAIFGTTQLHLKEDTTIDKREYVPLPNPQTESLLSEEIIQSQKTTSWRERAAWLRERRKAKLQPDTPKGEN